MAPRLSAFGPLLKSIIVTKGRTRQLSKSVYLSPTTTTSSSDLRRSQFSAPLTARLFGAGGSSRSVVVAPKTRKIFFARASSGFFSDSYVSAPEKSGDRQATGLASCLLACLLDATRRDGRTHATDPARLPARPLLAHETDARLHLLVRVGFSPHYIAIDV